MRMLFLASILCMIPVTREVSTGYFSYYNQAPTDGTLRYRQSVGDAPHNLYESYDGVIALATCDHLGDSVWVKVLDFEWLELLVFDCSGHIETTTWMKENRILGELGYYVTQDLEIDTTHAVYGRLSFEPPNHQHLPYRSCFMDP